MDRIICDQTDQTAVHVLDSNQINLPVYWPLRIQTEPHLAIQVSC